MTLEGTNAWLESSRRDAAALRALATHLVRDEHDAEDLVGETWIRARSSDSGPWTPSWLAAILRNLARDRLRARARRKRHEQEAARGELVPSAAEIVERLDLAQRLAAEVARLDEPYRTAIHLRFFEERTPDDIARLTRAPLETVRTRLRRGLAELRRRLDHAHGGIRERWLSALAPLAWPAPSAGTALAVTGGIAMGIKGVVTAAAALCLLLALVFFVRREEAKAPSPRAAQAGAGLEARAEPGRAETGGGERVAIASERPASETKPDTAPAGVLADIHGTVEIQDEQGEVHARESGTLTIFSGTNDKDMQRTEVAFDDGRWKARVLASGLVVVSRLVSRGREALLLDRQAPIHPGVDPIAVHGQWLARGRLRVIDAVTKQDLDQVELRCAAGWRANPLWTHPGDDARIQTVVSDGSSPLELPDRKHLTTYWVHVPGHAWGQIAIDPRKNVERTLELDPLPCTVEVEIAGPAPAGAFVRLYPLSKRPGIVETPDGLQEMLVDRAAVAGEPELLPDWCSLAAVHAREGGVTRIEELQADAFLAAVETGEYETRIRLGTAPVEVERGGIARVVVQIDPAALDLPRTHLFGTVRVPEGLDRQSCSLRLTRIAGGETPFEQRLIEMSFSNGDPDLLRWEAGLMRTGDYEAIFPVIQHRALVHAESKETRVELEIPPLVRVSVTVSDARSGQALVPDRIQWTGGAVEGLSGGWLVPVFKSSRAGTWEFVAPRGKVEVSCEKAGYRDASQVLVLSGSEAKCALILEPQR